MSASKMMHQDPSSCHVLKGACRKTSSGAGKNLPNRHPRKHRFHQMIRSAVSTTCMFVLALLMSCQTVQSAADPDPSVEKLDNAECVRRIRKFKNIENVLTTLVHVQRQWDSYDQVIEAAYGYTKWESDMNKGVYLLAKKSVEAVINEYIKCQSNDQLLSEIKNDVIEFTNTERTYNQSLEVLTFSCIVALRQKVQSHLAKFEAAERKAEEMAAEQDAAKQNAERLRARAELLDAMNLVATPLFDLPSTTDAGITGLELRRNLGRVLAKYPFDAGNHKGFLTAFKLEDDTHAELVKAWEIYKTHLETPKYRAYTKSFKETGKKCKKSKRKDVGIPGETAEREQEEIVIPDFLSTDASNGLLLQFDDPNGDHYIISNIRGAGVGKARKGPNDFGSQGRQKTKWIQQVFNTTGELKFYKYKSATEMGKRHNVFEKVKRKQKKEKHVNQSGIFQFMISTQRQLDDKKDETGAAKEFDITQDGGAEDLANFMKAALRSCEE